jgi:ribosomal-protein-alanine N-acetyltransferase
MPTRIYLRPPARGDESEFLAKVRASRSLHRPWVAAPATPEQFLAYVKRMTKDPVNFGWLVCSKETDDIAGVINATHIVRGIFRSAYLGYYAFAGFERRGLMREGLRAAVREAFGTLKLHRLEANIQPGNQPSIALAKSCGFSLEGYSPKYLKIGGRWRDHERWAIVSDASRSLRADSER